MASQGDDARERLRQAKASGEQAGINARDALYGAGAAAEAAARDGAQQARQAGQRLDSAARNEAERARGVLDDVTNRAGQEAERAKSSWFSFSNRANQEAENAHEKLGDLAKAAGDRVGGAATTAQREAQRANDRLGDYSQQAREQADQTRQSFEDRAQSAREEARKEAERAKSSWFSFSSKANKEADNAQERLGDWAKAAGDQVGGAARAAENEAQRANEKLGDYSQQARREAERAGERISERTDSAREEARKEAERAKSSWFSFTNKASKEAENTQDKINDYSQQARNKAERANERLSDYSESARKEAEQAQSRLRNFGDRANREAENAHEALGDLAKSVQVGVFKAGDKVDDATASARHSMQNLATDGKERLEGLAGQSSVTDPTGWVPRYTASDYVRFFSAGALCATITHGAMTPVDVVKTRLQLEPKGSKLGMGSMARTIVASEGPAGLMTGFGPTAVGYLIQGGSKFCGFEFFKAKFSIMAGSREAAERHRTLIYIGGASAAEFIASTLLTPLEAARIRLVSQRGYANGLAGAMTRMGREGGMREFYAGYVPILFKQIPFTQAQFTINEFVHELVNDHVDPKTIEKAGKTGEVGVSLFCGLMAGIGAAIASHPADTLLSRINKGDGGKGTAFQKMVTLTKESGFSGLWAGLGPRIVMQAGLICAQMALYDQIKAGLGAPAPVTIAKTNTESAH